MKRSLEEVLDYFSFLEDIHVVGGPVRDRCIGRSFDDVDLATSDNPEVVMDKTRNRDLRTIETGVEHGTVTVLLDREPIEITTFRRDISTDGRRADVEFTDSIEDDLARRDFTINAMALNSEGEVVDPFGGLEDLNREVIRTVGDSDRRFREDFLRIIRAARFSARYDFEISAPTYLSMRELSDQVLDVVSVERVVEEIEKAFKDSTPSRFLDTLFDLEILQELIPEFENMDVLDQNPEHHPEGDVFSHIKNVVDRADKDIRWHALLHDIGKSPVAEADGDNPWFKFYGHAVEGAERIDRIARDLRLSNDLRDSLKVVTKYHMHPLHAENQESPVSDKQIRRFQNNVGDELDNLQRLAEADHERGDSPLFNELEDPIEPVLMGRHLIDAGYDPGPQFGEALDAAFEHQINTGCDDIDELLEVAETELE